MRVNLSYFLPVVGQDIAAAPNSSQRLAGAVERQRATGAGAELDRFPSSGRAHQAQHVGLDGRVDEDRTHGALQARDLVGAHHRRQLGQRIAVAE